MLLRLRTEAPSSAAFGCALFFLLSVVSCSEVGERHLRNLQQLTFGGQNAEAYFSWDGRKLILQAMPRGAGCDQIYVYDIATGEQRLVSTGGGRTTCAYFFPPSDSGEQRIIYSSTHLGGKECPPEPDRSKGYTWAIYPDYDIFSAREDGSDLRRLTDAPGYDAEATVGHDGTVVFTSVRDGDLDLYKMNPDGTGVVRLTQTVGYDGGAFFSADGSKIVYRAHHPVDPEEVAEYRRLLEEGLVRPHRLEIFVMDADGSNPVQLTRNGAANFAPFFHPSGEKVIFSSNMDDPTGRNFDLYMVDVAARKIERVTTHPSFDGFPMFRPDGRLLVFASNRDNEIPRETNVFLAEWIE